MRGRITRRELKLMNACIDMASVEFEGRKDEIKAELGNSGNYEFFCIRYAESEFYRLEAEVLTGRGRLNFIRLMGLHEDNFFVEVERKGKGVSIESLQPLFEDLKLHLRLLRERTLFLKICPIVEATQERVELTEEDDVYFIEYEIRDSQLVFYAQKTIEKDTFLVVEFKTTEPFDKGIAGLYDAIVSHYESLKNNSVLCSG